jgi:hypothetical protein
MTTVTVTGPSRTVVLAPPAAKHPVTAVAALFVTALVVGCVITVALGYQAGPSTVSRDNAIAESTTPSATSDMRIGGAALPGSLVSSCGRVAHGSQQVHASGSIVNHSTVTSDYRLVVGWFDGSSQVARLNVNKTAVSPGMTARWSAVALITGSAAVAVTCRMMDILQTPTYP